MGQPWGEAPGRCCPWPARLTCGPWPPGSAVQLSDRREGVLCASLPQAALPACPQRWEGHTRQREGPGPRGGQGRWSRSSHEGGRRGQGAPATGQREMAPGRLFLLWLSRPLLWGQLRSPRRPLPAARPAGDPGRGLRNKRLPELWDGWSTIATHGKAREVKIRGTRR